MSSGFSPDFFVIGVVKGGTTSLYSYLYQHPEIFLPKVKETNHFAKRDISAEDFLSHYARDVSIDLEGYISDGMPYPVHIAHVDDPGHYRALFKPAEEGQRTGDVSNSYMICPSACGQICKQAPEAKLIAVLRDPVSRIWSQYLMNLREDKEHLPFLEAIEKDARRSPKGWGVSHQYLELGRYAEQLKPFFQRFPKQNIRIVFFEDFVTETDRVLSELCEFLGVDPTFSFDTSGQRNKAAMPKSKVLNKLLTKSGAIHRLKRRFPEDMKAKVKNLLYTDKHVPKLGDEEEEFLIDHYAAEVGALSALLGRRSIAQWPRFNKG